MDRLPIAPPAWARSWVLALLVLGSAAGPPTAQERDPRFLLTAMDGNGRPVPGLLTDDVTVMVDGLPREVTALEQASDPVQVVVLFEGLAASPQLVSQAITTFSGALSTDSVLDVFTVDADLAGGIIEAAADLTARSASRPVVVLLGQAERLRQSRVGLTIAREVAGDLEGDVEEVAAALADARALFYGISVTNVPLPQLEHLSSATGGRFEIVAGAGEVTDALASIARELAGQYLVSYAPPAEARSALAVQATDTIASARVAVAP